MTTEKFESKVTDALMQAVTLFSLRNPGRIAWGLVFSGFFYGGSAEYYGEPVHLALCVSAGIAVGNFKSLVAHLKGEAELDEGLVKALTMIKKFETEGGGTKEQVRALYFDLTVKMIEDSGRTVDVKAPHQELGGEILDGEVLEGTVTDLPEADSKSLEA